MKTFGTPLVQPLRRDLADPRSSRGTAPSARKTLLNDTRSTGGRDRT